MQTVFCFFLLFTVSMAEYGDISVYNTVESFERNDSPTETIMKPFNFGYHLNNTLNMRIYLKNKPKSVDVDVWVKYPNDLSNIVQSVFDKKEDYFQYHRLLKDPKVIIYLTLSTHTGGNKNTCESKTIIKANTAQNDTEYYDICLQPEPCVLVVDLRKYEYLCSAERRLLPDIGLPQASPQPPDRFGSHPSDPRDPHRDFGSPHGRPSKAASSVPDTPANTPLTATEVVTPSQGITVGERKKDKRTEEITTHEISTEIDISNSKVGEPSESSSSKVLMYVIPAVLVTCVIVVVLYLRVRKHCHRSPQPEGIEVNTYATANEVVYAHLSLEQGNNQPPRRDESPYAQIIGVMRPVPS